MEQEQDQRKRNLAGDQARLSNWHSASQPRERKFNNLEEVNKVGASYASLPNSQDAEALLGFFHGFLLKYLGLLSTGKIGHPIPNDTKQFLALLVPKIPNATRGQVQAMMRKAAERLPQAFISMTADDIYNELACIFLTLAAKFDSSMAKEGSNFGFTGYMKYHFKFAVKQRMFKVQDDATNYQPMHSPELETDDPDADPTEQLVSRDQIQDPDEGTLEFPTLNRSFISMPPAPFDRLWSTQERAVVVYRYFEDLSWSAISDKLQLGGAKKVEEIHDKALDKYRASIHYIKGAK